MMLFKLSVKNIKKSIKDYAIYFFTLILGVAIFYVFNSIESQTIMLNVSSNTRDIIKLMMSILSGVSVFVSCILGFLIIYASRFLIKRRNKEFGIYLTLGMSKRKISTILFFETLLIGILSLLVGLFLGVFLSQFMSLLVANMFEAKLTEFVFTFSSSALVKTLIYFGIMYLLVMIFNTINVNRYKLIDLLQSHRKNEKIKLKNPIFCTVVFIISVIMLSYAYYLVTSGLENLRFAKDIFKPIILGCISTVLIFWSLSGLIIRIMMYFKKSYYKGLNSFIVRQISSKINTTVISISVICIMLFVTICVFSSALSIKNSMSKNLKTLVPMDLQIIKSANLDESDFSENANYKEEQISYSKKSIKDTLLTLGFNSDKYLKDYYEYGIYATDQVTLKDTLGVKYEFYEDKFSFNNFSASEMIMKLSDYNRLAELFNEEKYTLENDEYIMISDYKDIIDMRNDGLKANTSINIGDSTLFPKYDKCKDGFVIMSSNHSNFGIIVVPDEVLDDNMKSLSLMVSNYDVVSEEEKENIEKIIIEDLEKNELFKATTLNIYTKKKIYDSSIGLGAMATFIGLYLGIIFLISSAAILALKELSESTDNKNRFMMLRRIGVSEKMIKGALFKQIAVFFMAPLLLAIIHSIFGIKFSITILSIFGSNELLPSTFMTAVFLIFIYGGYFFITYHSSKNIIKVKD